MKEKFNQYGQITNPEDAHELTMLEEVARKAESAADAMMDGDDLESLGEGERAYETARIKREIADEALRNY